MSRYRSRPSLTFAEQEKFSWLFPCDGVLLTIKDCDVAISNHYKSALPAKTKNEFYLELQIDLDLYAMHTSSWWCRCDARDNRQHCPWRRCHQRASVPIMAQFPVILLLGFRPRWEVHQSCQNSSDKLRNKASGTNGAYLSWITRSKQQKMNLLPIITAVLHKENEIWIFGNGAELLASVAWVTCSFWFRSSDGSVGNASASFGGCFMFTERKRSPRSKAAA